MRKGMFGYLIMTTRDMMITLLPVQAFLYAYGVHASCTLVAISLLSTSTSHFGILAISANIS